MTSIAVYLLSHGRSILGIVLLKDMSGVHVPVLTDFEKKKKMAKKLMGMKEDEAPKAARQ